MVEAFSAEQSSLDGWEEGTFLSEVNSLHTIILPRTYLILGILIVLISCLLGVIDFEAPQKSLIELAEIVIFWNVLFLEFENPPELSSKRIHSELQYSSFTPKKRQCSEMISENSDTFMNNVFEAANIQRISLSPIQSQQTRMIADKPSVLSSKLQNEQVDNSKIIGNTVCHFKPFKPICSHKKMSIQYSAYPNCFAISICEGGEAVASRAWTLFWMGLRKIQIILSVVILLMFSRHVEKYFSFICLCIFKYYFVSFQDTGFVVI